MTQTGYGTSPQQAKGCVLGITKDPYGSVFDLAAEVGRLVDLAHPYLLAEESDALVVDYVTRGVNNKCLEAPLDGQYLNGRNAVLAIKEYIAIDGSEQPSCKAKEEEGTLSQLEKVSAVQFSGRFCSL